MTIEAAPKEFAKMVKGCEQETFIDAWMRFLPLPATYDEKGREIQGNRENGEVAER
ncbi:MAG: hypothetical protein ABSB63_21305 [Spirochaetia bacterium]|jgi:hypothetical protein